jgi:hypothetical protein
VRMVVRAFVVDIAKNALDRISPRAMARLNRPGIPGDSFR